MTADQIITTSIAAGVPTLAVIAAFVRNEMGMAGLAARLSSLEARITSLENRLDARITTLESRLDARIETLDRDLREWAKITLTHNSDIARLKDKAGLDR